VASIDEFITSVQSNIEALKQAQTSMDGAKQQAEELSSQFQSLGAESMATGAQSLKQGVEEAQSGVVPVITQLEQLITQAQGLKSLRGTGGVGTHNRPPPTPLDAAPAALKEPVAQVGDPVTAPEPKPSAFQQELDGPDEDAASDKFGRFTQAMASGADDLSQYAKQITDNALAAMRSRDPNPPTGATHTSATPPQPVISAPAAKDPPVADVVSTGVMLGAVTLTYLHNVRERRRERKRSDG